VKGRDGDRVSVGEDRVRDRVKIGEIGVSHCVSRQSDIYLFPHSDLLRTRLCTGG
jgi:hypothetical protein